MSFLQKLKFLIPILVLLTVVLGENYDERPYVNLYGRDLPKSGIAENLVNIAAGGMGFVMDGTRFMNQEPQDTTPRNNEKYDFIVVGAGTAGATIASRLSEMKNASVLLIEAGRSENIIMDIPVIVNYLQFSEELNWMYKTEPSNSYCQGMKNKQCLWPRGRVMGGSSVLNYMIATRGNKKDYDRWAELGNNGWSWKEVLPYFKKLETLGIPEFRQDTKYHNFDGPVYVGYPPFHTPLATAFVEAGVELGYKEVDYNGETQTGFSYLQTTIKNGTRMSSSRAYLHGARKRQNLIVTKKTLVTKILLDEDNRKAIGVQFRKKGITYEVYARKEVILCAGAIGSPQLLMLSGIGPATHLQDVGIKSVADLPVGENLMDHISYGGLVFMANQPVGLTISDIVNPSLPYLRDYLVNRTGPMTMPGGSEALAFVNVDDPYDKEDFPNIELLFICTSVASVPVFREDVGLDDEFFRKSYGGVNKTYTWTAFPMLMRPKSRGKLMLRDGNIKSKPKLIPNYMADPDDVRILVKGIRATIAVSKTKSMQKFGSKLYDTPLAGCEHFEYDSDEYWECAVRSFTMNIYHYSGTCKMGPENDPTAVVNPRLKVTSYKFVNVASEFGISFMFVLETFSV